MSRSTVLTRAHPGFASSVILLRDALSAWAKRSRERAMLSRLDAHLLRDIGLDADRVAEECRKPAWRA